MNIRSHAGDAGNYLGQHYFGEEKKAIEIPTVIVEVEEFEDVLEVSPNILDGLHVQISSAALGESKYGKFVVGVKAAEQEFASEFEKGAQKWNNPQTIVQLVTASAIDAIQCGEFREGPDGIIHATYKLSTGLPINEAKDKKRKEQFINKLKSNIHTVQFFNANDQFNERIVKINYQRVIVSSEGNAAHVSLSRDDDLTKRTDRPFTSATYILNDIGGGTNDIGVIREGKRIDSNLSQSYDLGVSPEIDKIIDEVADKYGYRFTSRQHFTVCATKHNYSILIQGVQQVDISDIARKYLKPLAQQVIRRLDATWKRVPEAVAAAFVGGGALLLRPYLEEINSDSRNLWFCNSPEESRWMMASAYEKLNRIYDQINRN